MNFNSTITNRPVFLPTGYDHIDYGSSEARRAGTSSNDWLSFKPLVDPIDVKIQATTSEVRAMPGLPIKPEINFWTIATAYNVDSYLATALDKYRQLVAKEGWQIRGKDQKAVEYIKQRIRLLPLTCRKTFDLLLRDIEYSTVVFANAYLIKVPFKGVDPIPGMRLSVPPSKAIGGLYTVHPGRFEVVVDDMGMVLTWDFMVNGAIWATFTPDQIIHFKHNSPPDYLYGQPHYLPCLEDIRTYRQLEYLTVMLVNRYLHPVIHVRKGWDPTRKQIINVKPADIAELDSLIRSQNADGIFVTGPDVDIAVHGMESQALRADPYLTMWRKRVFAGLAVSDIAMGEETAANRSTADAITAEMHDHTKCFQNTIEDYINADLIYHWLIEGGFDPIMDEKLAYFEYNTISIDENIKSRNQTIQEWFAGAMTHDEFRQALSMEPLDPKLLMSDTYFALTAKVAAMYSDPGTSSLMSGSDPKRVPAMGQSQIKVMPTNTPNKPNGPGQDNRQKPAKVKLSSKTPQPTKTGTPPAKTVKAPSPPAPTPPASSPKSTSDTRGVPSKIKKLKGRPN